MTKPMPTVEEVAQAFIAQLRQDISAEDFAEVVSLQKSTPLDGVCYSHDFCDANMTMDAALASLGVEALPEEGGMSDEVCLLWNTSWDRAKEILSAL